MVTATGRRYYPADPRAEDVCLEDVAHHLAKLCRYNGAVQRFYSVAEHSVLVSRAVPPEYALHGLLHDAAEAYTGDFHYAVKNIEWLRPSLKILERINEKPVFEYFGLERDDIANAAVKEMDDRIVLDEVTALFPVACEEVFRERHATEPTGQDVAGWWSEVGKMMFVQRFNELVYGIPVFDYRWDEERRR
jgi:hypothetical protein